MWPGGEPDVPPMHRRTDKKFTQSKQRALLPVALPITVGMPSSNREVSVKTKPPIKTPSATPKKLPSEVVILLM